MNFAKKYLLGLVVLGMASLMTPEASFIKKKKNGPNVTECCDTSADLLALSAQLVSDLGAAQQEMIRMSREVIEGDKKNYLIAADKEQLKTYYERTQECKNALDKAQNQIISYHQYLQSLS